MSGEQWIAGVTVKGDGDATQNYPRAMAPCSGIVPGIMEYAKFGTLNVQLEEAIDKSRAHYWVLGIAWTPIGFQGCLWPQSEKACESFGFIRAKLEYPPKGQRYDVWIVMPDSANRWHDRIEILAREQIGGSRLPYGSPCAISIDQSCLKVRPEH
jgi:hypothetical protein